MFHLGINVAPNLGLAYIAAVLEKDGVEVKVLDAAAEGIFFDEVVERIREFRPHLIGAGGQTPVSPRSLTIFRRAKKEADPSIVTLAGGPHFSFTDQESLEECSELDIVVRGEGEETIRELCQKLEAGESLDEVKGITYRNSKGRIARNEDRDPIANLDSLPFPAWHLFPVERYHWAGNRVIGISSSRGCPYRCPHCITWKVHKGVRTRNPRKIVEEMLWVKRNFNHDTFFFQDDTSFLSREQMEVFLDELERCGEKLYWYYETREDVFYSYRDLWRRMTEAGLFKVVLGLETPDPRIRETYGKKGFDRQVVEEMIDTLEKELDVLVSVCFLFGSPEDTDESMEATLKYGRYLYPDHCSFIVGSIAAPFPGTDMFERLKEQQMITSFDWKEYGFGKSVVKTSVPPERMAEIFTGFWFGTYVRPKVFKEQLRNLFSRNRFRRAIAKNYINTAVDLFKMRGKTDSTF
jgi:radical SAM superfamily enzyme YgiQ (UPF0313 family)